MGTVTVTTQTELDDALTAGAARIIIHSPRGVWLAMNSSTTSKRATGASSAPITAEARPPAGHSVCCGSPVWTGVRL